MKRLRLPKGDNRALERITLRLPEDVAMVIRLAARRHGVTVNMLAAMHMTEWANQLLEADPLLAARYRLAGPPEETL